jgi:hypothetical protein
MPYEPGPFILQSQANVGITTVDYDFTDFAISGLADVDTTLAGWDPFFADAGVLLNGPSDPWPGISIDGAIADLGTYSDPVDLLGVNGMISALGDADLGLAIAIGFAPSESWVAPTTDFVSPSPAELIPVPTIPAGAIDFSVTGTVSAPPVTTPPVITAQGPGVTLTNTTAYGNPNFTVGDQFTVTAYGPPGQAVSVYATLNGVALPAAAEGLIGLNLSLTINGTMGPGDVGVWTQNWYVGGVLANSFEFVVVE